ncbi:hypothetical protein NF27_AK00090 [Candidatus Jidaibacter acanthamoeba]|uniref:PIN domain-containing protein n=1 Tax=Candidatus Jidaibacter acanthamoebae TaxID=86105 RepID=A0A0C1MVK5_9RICK|nr:hypothetical protein [Candidatus Jidaibacter acanthamoeba]KIE06277.1 hypothetical protein NF27_AK00090 [Candidatus Jidaibacter acanthamoeba]
MNLDKYRNIIIDTSAFMAFFYQEEGWELVAKYMPKSILSAVNLSEAIKIFKEYEDISKEQSLEYIYKAVEKIIPFDEHQAGIAGEMGKYYKTIWIITRRQSMHSSRYSYRVTYSDG